MQQRTSCGDQVHAVLARSGIPVTRSGCFGPGGGIWLDGLRLPQPYAGKVASLRGTSLELSLRHWDIGKHGVWGGLVTANRAELRARLLLDPAAVAGPSLAG